VTPDFFDPLLLPESARIEQIEDDEPVAVAAAAAQPDVDPSAPSGAPIVTVEGVTAGGDKEQVTAQIDMGPKYIVESEDDLPEGVEADNAGGDAVITAEVIVDADDDRVGEADVTVAMTDEVLADVPADTLPPGMGAVTVSGDAASVWLVSNQGRVEPGLVLAGNYRVMANFGDDKETGAGDINVAVGMKVALRCDAMFRRCVRETAE
jgi:hypothetical protein